MKHNYLDRIQACFPDLFVSDVQTIDEGLVNDVVIINRKRVFRLPVAERAREDQRRETNVLRLVEGYVNVPVPVIDRIDDKVLSCDLGRDRTGPLLGRYAGVAEGLSWRSDAGFFMVYSAHRSRQ